MKKNIFAILLFIPLIVFSHDDCESCREVEGHPAEGLPEWVVHLQQASTSLNWWSATPAQVAAAPCRQSIPSDAQMREWLAAFDSGTKANKDVNGISLQNESVENIRALEHLTTLKDWRKNPLTAQQPQYNSNCTTALCAATELLGDSGVMALYMQRRYGFTASHLAYNETSPWTRAQLSQALTGVLEFPQGVFPLEEARPFVRYKAGQLPTGYAQSTVADSFVRFFDRWLTLPDGEKQANTSHELGHAIAAESGADRSAAWYALSGWESYMVAGPNGPEENFKANIKEAIVSGYGSTSPAEDFAESVAAYRYNPQHLRTRSPAKYEFIKHSVFNGVEYTSAAACSQPDNYSTQLAAAVRPRLEAWNPSAADLNRMSKTCLSTIFTTMGSGAPGATLTSAPVQNCLADAPQAEVRRWMKDSAASRPWGAHIEPMLRNTNVELPTALVNRMQGSAASFGAQMRQSLSTVLPTVFQAYLPSLSRSGCEQADFSQAYTYYTPVYQTSPNDPERYRARAQIADSVRQMCLDVVQARSNPNTPGPLKTQEMTSYLKKLFP
jgi:hypothetical protein